MPVITEADTAPISLTLDRPDTGPGGENISTGTLPLVSSGAALCLVITASLPPPSPSDQTCYHWPPPRHRTGQLAAGSAACSAAANVLFNVNF